jgi:hypothetical protein
MNNVHVIHKKSIDFDNGFAKPVEDFFESKTFGTNHRMNYIILIKYNAYMPSIDERGQILNPDYRSPEKIGLDTPQLFDVDRSVSSRISDTVRVLNLSPLVIAVGCTNPLEAEGMTVQYFDPYDSVGRPDETIEEITNPDTTVFIDAEYGGDLQLPTGSCVVTSNAIRRILISDRPLIAIVKGGEVITDNDKLKPYKEELKKPAEVVEKESEMRRIAFRQKLLGEEIGTTISPDITHDVLCVFGKSEE